MTYLQQALLLAQERRGFCAPNPSVGAIVVKNRQVLSVGNHFKAGYPHAEVMALQSLGQKAKGATLYCTLEPCCHWGKTPPCTDLIIQSGIKKVIYGFKDPNPEVSQKSKKILETAGIQTEYVNTKEISEFYKSYRWWWKHKLPYITAKLAIGLDGKVALTKITGKTAEIFTHQARLKSDAILTTAKTILYDNPRLNVRLNKKIIKKPVYIIDRQNILPKEAQIFRTASSVKIFNQPDITLENILKNIGQDGIHDLWVEAGNTLFQALIQQKLIQKAYIYIAPKINLFKDVKRINWDILGQDGLVEFNWE